MNRALAVLTAAMLALPVSSGAADTAHQALPACVTPDDTCKESMAVGSVGQYTFWYYRSYSLTATNADITRAVIVMHGMERNASDYFNWAVTGLGNATDPSLVVIAPHFKGNVTTSTSCRDPLVDASELHWSCTGSPSVNRWDDGGSARNISEQVFSFSMIDMLVNQLSDTTVFPNLAKIYISGHSAGGQFTQRYAGGNQIDAGLAAPAMSRMSRARPVVRAPAARTTSQPRGLVSVNAVTVPIKYVIANPGSYMYVDNRRLQKDATCLQDGTCTGTFTPTWDPNPDPITGCMDTYNNYKYGLDGRTFGYMDSGLPGMTDAEVRTRFTSRNVAYLMGEMDQTSGSMFDQKCEANAQGSHVFGDGSGLVGGRRERGTIFWNYMRQLNATNQTLTIVPTCAHDGQCMYMRPETIQALST